MKIYKYNQYFGRMGSLSSVFVASDEDIASMRSAGSVYLGEVLGKHSEISADIDDKTLVELPSAPVVVEFLIKHAGGCIGLNLVSYHRDQ